MSKILQLLSEPTYPRTSQSLCAHAWTQTAALQPNQFSQLSHKVTQYVIEYACYNNRAFCKLVCEPGSICPLSKLVQSIEEEHAYA